MYKVVIIAMIILIIILTAFCSCHYENSVRRRLGKSRTAMKAKITERKKLLKHLLRLLGKVTDDKDTDDLSKTFYGGDDLSKDTHDELTTNIDEIRNRMHSFWDSIDATNAIIHWIGDKQTGRDIDNNVTQMMLKLCKYLNKMKDVVSERRAFFSRRSSNDPLADNKRQVSPEHGLAARVFDKHMRHPLQKIIRVLLQCLTRGMKIGSILKTYRKDIEVTAENVNDRIAQGDSATKNLTDYCRKALHKLFKEVPALEKALTKQARFYETELERDILAVNRLRRVSQEKREKGLGEKIQDFYEAMASVDNTLLECNVEDDPSHVQHELEEYLLTEGGPHGPPQQPVTRTRSASWLEKYIFEEPVSDQRTITLPESDMYVEEQDNRRFNRRSSLRE